MKVGDLVKKVKGYGQNCGWTGIVVGFEKRKSDSTKQTLVVFAEDGINKWLPEFCEVINGQYDSDRYSGRYTAT